MPAFQNILRLIPPPPPGLTPMLLEPNRIRTLIKQILGSAWSKDLFLNPTQDWCGELSLFGLNDDVYFLCKCGIYTVTDVTDIINDSGCNKWKSLCNQIIHKGGILINNHLLVYSRVGVW